MINMMITIAVLIFVYLLKREVDALREDIDQLRKTSNTDEAMKRIRSIVDKYDDTGEEE